MKKFKFLESGLAGDIFYDPEVEPVGSVILSSGFPAFIGSNDATSVLVKSRFIVIQPHYHGSYDSDGEFSPRGIRKTYSDLYSILAQGGVQNLGKNEFFPIRSLPKISIGHSFGAFGALRNADQCRSIEKLILMAPAVHYGRSNPDFGLKEDGIAHFNYVRKAWPRTYRIAPESDWLDICNGRDRLPTNKDHPTLEEVICVVGQNDKYFDIGALQMNLASIVQAYVGIHANIRLIVIPEAGHYISELVARPPIFSLAQIVNPN